MKQLQETLSQISGGKILDVGTGRGEFIDLLNEYLKDYAEIIGIDMTDRAIAHCEDKYKDFPTIQVIKMDATHMDFLDETFDTVCISNTIHHLQDYHIILNEMKRVLKPNGNFIISEMFSDHQTPEQLSHVKIHHFGAKIDVALGNFHDETYTKDRIIQISKELGLHDLNILEYRYPMEDPKDPELIDYLSGNCDMLLERVKDHEHYAEFKKEAEEIKDYLKENGFMSATELLVIGKK